MGLLLMQFRKQQLLQAHNNIQFQLNNLNEQLMDLQSMAGTLSNDNVSMQDIASMPASLFGYGVDQLMMAHGSATQYANTVMQNMMNGSIFSQFGDNAAQMQQIAYMKAYEQGMEHMKKRMKAQLNEQEKQIQRKKTELETRDACIEEELKAVSQKLPQEVSSSISHYGLQG